MKFDKTAWFCWNSDQNCIQNCQSQLLCMSPRAFRCQLSRILDQSAASGIRDFDNLIDRLAIIWLLYCLWQIYTYIHTLIRPNSGFGVSFLSLNYLDPRPYIKILFAPAKSIFTFFSCKNLDIKVSFLHLLFWGKV